VFFAGKAQALFFRFLDSTKQSIADAICPVGQIQKFTFQEEIAPCFYIHLSLFETSECTH
jgi:hypothetical protein